MDTVAKDAFPHNNTSQGTNVDLKYSWTQWPKIPVHTTIHPGYNCGLEILVDTVAKDAFPHHNTSQGINVDLKYLWTLWPKVPVHTTPQHIPRCNYRAVILPDHSGLRWQFTSCGTNVAL
jgi:hypothetical protein